MRLRGFAFVALAPLTAGCDTHIDRRVAVRLENPAAISDAETIVRTYAAKEALACARKPDYMICEQQPIHVFFRAVPSGAEVCYSAMAAQIEKTKFEARIAELGSMLANRFGDANVKIAEPLEKECWFK
jgi:hypothetical protein